MQRSQSPLDWRKRDHDKREENLKATTGASCQSKPSPESQIEGCVKDGRLQLANGQSLLYAAALYNYKIRNELPLFRWFVGSQPSQSHRAEETTDVMNRSGKTSVLTIIRCGKNCSTGSTLVAMQGR